MTPGVLVGAVGTAYCLLWVINPGKATTRVLGGFYDALGSWIWFGSRDSYVQFMRWSGCFGVAISLGMLIGSLLTR